MAKLAVGYGCPEVLAFLRALGLSDTADVCAIDIRIRPDEIITARIEIPVGNEALAELESVAARSEGRIVILNADSASTLNADSVQKKMCCTRCGWKGPASELLPAPAASVTKSPACPICRIAAYVGEDC